MHALMRRLVVDFQTRQPKVSIDLRSGGSTKAITEFLEPPQPGRIVVKEERAKQALLVSSSRELTDSEMKQFSAQRGYEPLIMPIAVDAVALYVHKDNPLPGLTLDQADAIFSTDRRRGLKKDIGLWGDLAMDNGWEQARIQLYGPKVRNESFLSGACNGWRGVQADCAGSSRCRVSDSGIES